MANTPYITGTTNASGTTNGVLTFAVFPAGIRIGAVCWLIGSGGVPGSIQVKVTALNVTGLSVTVQAYSTAMGAVPNYGGTNLTTYGSGSTLTQPAQDILDTDYTRVQFQLDPNTGVLKPVGS
jgi:hypothetical protein